ncbi:hypothetical protein GCM10023189_48080 [Nibrella saemangeumensis]|uniref:Uncharacterized protein n=1 Tax=Nibrella saemangeumensis TaxID=1084526 RepID=A0ABP8NF31_9BACT
MCHTALVESYVASNTHQMHCDITAEHAWSENAQRFGLETIPIPCANDNYLSRSCWAEQKLLKIRAVE